MGHYDEYIVCIIMTNLFYLGKLIRFLDNFDYMYDCMYM